MILSQERWVQMVCALTHKSRSSLTLGIGALGKLAQMGGISFAPNQNGDVTQAFEQMQALPIPSVDATAFIDPNLLGEVRFHLYSRVFSILGRSL